MLFLFRLSTKASTPTWSKSKRATHPGCQSLLKRKPGFDQCLSHPGQNRDHQWRWRRGMETTGQSVCSQTGTKCCYCRGTLPKCPVASPADGPRHWEACSPVGGLRAPLPPFDRNPGSWTRKCARRACTGCIRRQTAHMPPGSLHPLLRRQNQTSVQLLTVGPWQTSASLLWLAVPRRKTRAPVSSG